MRISIERPNDIRVFAKDLIATLDSDLSMVKKAKEFEKKIFDASQDEQLVLEMFDVPDLKRFQYVWSKLEVEAERKHAKECDVCTGDVADQKDQFVESIKKAKEELGKVIKLELASSSDRLVANYSKTTSAFSAVVEVRVSGVTVICVDDGLREIIDERISTISKDQTSRNFLYCVAGVLPEEYKEYRLVL